MLCEKCGKNNATTHIKTVINGTVTELNLCGYCAAKEGYTNFTKGSISNLFASMLGSSLEMGSRVSTRKCSFCNASFADIAETGKVGCSHCYTEFKNELLPYLKRIHGSVKHNGKISGTKEIMVTGGGDRLSELKAKLAKLVANENYEEAAIVRDEIRKEEGK